MISLYLNFILFKSIILCFIIDFIYMERQNLFLDLKYAYIYRQEIRFIRR